MRLVAGLAAAPRRGLAILRERGLSCRGDIRADDLRWIAMAIEAEADGRTIDQIKLAAQMLAARGCYDPEDRRAFVHGGKWGPDSLVHLFTSILPYDPDDADPAVTVVSRASGELIEITENERDLLKTFQGMDFRYAD